MELYLTRADILRQVRAMLGMQTTASLAGQVDTQHVIAVQAAAIKAQQDCRWVNLQRHISIELGIQQYQVPYPTNTTPGSILGMSVYKDDRYYPLESRIIPSQADTDVEEAIGGVTYQSVCGRPKYYECREMIYLWPPTDQAYHLRVEIQPDFALTSDASVSPIDGQMIIYKAAEMISVQHGDRDQAAYYQGLYQDRFMALRGWQSSQTRFPMNSEADLGEDEFYNQDLLPNWNRGVTPPLP